MGKEAIIEKIMSDAQARADAMIGEARAKAADIFAEAAQQCKDYCYASQHNIDLAVADVLRRGKTVAELDARKALLQAKTDVLDAVYSRVLELLRGLNKTAYKKLTVGMLALAEDGDVVKISAREKGIVTAKTVADVAAKKGIKLSLSAEPGDFDGGMVLSGGGIDKNLTFEVELSMLREETEAEIAGELFG